jgi:hypothetical protein
MKKFINQTIAWSLIILVPLYLSFPVYSQDEGDANQQLFTEEEEDNNSLFEESDQAEDFNSSNNQQNDQDDSYSDSSTDSVSEKMDADLVDEIANPNPGDKKISTIQNAILEGIQLSSEPGESSDEKIVTCYFIFRDKPSSYFYEALPKEKEIVFEFNDVEVGSSPILSAKEPPIQGFRFQSQKIDANKEVVGLNPEWHDILKVHFFFDAIPEITVKDEYSVISFAFKWTTNPEKVKQYTQRYGVNKPLLISLIGGGIAIPAVVALVLLSKNDGPDEPLPLSIEDLPSHPSTE